MSGCGLVMYSLLVATLVVCKSWKVRMDPGLNPREVYRILSSHHPEIHLEAGGGGKKERKTFLPIVTKMRYSLSG